MDVLYAMQEQEILQNNAANKSKYAKQSQVDFDYRPWQRTARPRLENEKPKISTGLSPGSGKTNDDSWPISRFSIHTACSSKCQHSWNKKHLIPPINVEEDKGKRKLFSRLKVKCCQKVMYFQKEKCCQKGYVLQERLCVARR